MNRNTIAFNLIALFGVVFSLFFTPTNAQARYSEQENQLSIMLASSVEFRWDSNKKSRHSHESLGTKISANTVLTHNHFSDLASTFIVDPSNPKRPHSITNMTRTTSFGSRSHQNSAQTRLVYSEIEYSGSFAPIASQQTIKRLRAGDIVDVVYWDDAGNQLAVAEFEIKSIQQGSLIIFNDTHNIINGGDSGGGVFHNGKLIGNTWRYLEIFDRLGNKISKEVHAQIIPAEITSVIGQW